MVLHGNVELKIQAKSKTFCKKTKNIQQWN
jgi:hypothetical protein